MAHRYRVGRESVRYILSDDENRELAELIQLAKLNGNVNVKKADAWIALLCGDEGNTTYET